MGSVVVLAVSSFGRAWSGRNNYYLLLLACCLYSCLLRMGDPISGLDWTWHGFWERERFLGVVGGGGGKTDWVGDAG